MDKFFLHINEPCQQDWNSMTTSEQGKFCNSCEKNVIDFTGSSNSEIIQFFKRAKSDEVCGRFYEYQLNTWLDNSKIKSVNPRLYKFLVSVMLMAAAQNSSAQEINKTQVEQTVIGTQTLKLNIQTTSKSANCDSIQNGVYQNRKITLGSVRSVAANGQPLLIVDGKTLKLEELSKIDPNTVKSVNILKVEVSTAIYGPEGVYGAIIIETKACAENKNMNEPTS